MELITPGEYASGVTISAIAIGAAPIVMAEALFESGLLYPHELRAAQVAFNSAQGMLPFGMGNSGGRT
jgi:hypothetical protein